ncbi:MAG TPA: MaoC family dehydratase, partial [Streptosporangiaceae bacterium]|nr:MaoC family dehydratase [Streptosporangiaceae bacterium]
MGVVLMGLAGHQLPPGSARLEPYQNWLLHDAFYSPPGSEPHPVAAFVLANRGMGISLADLFRLFGSDIDDGPLLAESSIELHCPLAEDADYEVRGVVESVERRRSRRIGPFDRITCRFDLFQNGAPAATVTNVFAIPREPKGRGAVWTIFSPPNPPQERGTSDEARQHLESGPEASGGEIRVDPARMKTLALLLADPNPIHLDAAAARRLGVAGRPVNQGPSTMAMAANMLLAAFPGARLTRFSARLLGLVLAGDGVEGGGSVIEREILDGQERVRCQVHL